MNDKKILFDVLMAHVAAYEAGKPIISDKEFDEKVTRYMCLGGNREDLYGGNLVKSPYPMMSQQNLYTMDAVADLVQGKGKFIMTPKYDGVSVYFIIDPKSKEIEQVYSRHNKRLKPFPEQKLIKLAKTYNCFGCLPESKYDKLYVRAEVICPFSVFKSKYADRYANPRNMVAGALNKAHPHEGMIEDFDLKIFDASVDLDYSEIMSWANIHPVWELNIGDPLARHIDRFQRLVKELDYECDGIVLRINKTQDRIAGGHNDHHWNLEGAYKNFEQEELETELLDVEWNINDTGRLTPVGILRPIKFKDATVSRVMLNSPKFIDEMNIMIGSTLTVIKSGDIIPVVIEAEGGHKHIQIFECPSCGTTLKKDGAYKKCPYARCLARRTERLAKQIEKAQELVNVKGVSKASATKLALHGYDFRDVITIACPKQIEAILGKSMAGKVNELVTKLRNTPVTLGEAIRLLQIEGWGKTVTRKFGEYAAQFEDTEFFCASGHGLLHEAEWATHIANFFISHSEINSKVLNRTLEALKQHEFAIMAYQMNIVPYEPPKDVSGQPKFIVTGSLDGIKKKAFAANLEGKAVEVSTVSKADYVVCNNPASGSSKIKQAEKKGIPVVSQAEFMRMVA